MWKRYYERWLAGVAAVAFVGSCGFAVWNFFRYPDERSRIDRSVTFPRSSRSFDAQREDDTVGSMAVPHEERDKPSVVSPRGSRSRNWPEPRSEARGAIAAFDLFTPPVLYFDDVNAAWTSTAPVKPEAEPRDELPANPGLGALGFSLVDVKADLFRLQLVGYGGGRESLFGMFQDSTTGETVIARAGQALSKLDLVVLAIERKPVRIDSSETEALADFAVFARVQEISTGTETILSTSERLTVGSPTAFIRVSLSGEIRQCKAGDEFAIAGRAYHVSQVDLTNRSIEVSERTSSGDLLEANTLKVGPPSEAVQSRSETLVASSILGGGVR